jgi:hypothetical protein
MKNYMKKSISDADRELQQYRGHMDREKAVRIQELEEEHTRKVKEMEDRQERLVNVDEMLKK